MINLKQPLLPPYPYWSRLSLVRILPIVSLTTYTSANKNFIQDVAKINNFLPTQVGTLLGAVDIRKKIDLTDQNFVLLFPFIKVLWFSADLSTEKHTPECKLQPKNNSIRSYSIVFLKKMGHSRPLFFFIFVFSRHS